MNISIPRKILITGKTGLIGRFLAEYLEKSGYQVLALTRNRLLVDGINYFYWNPEKGEMDGEWINKVDAIIHLAGSNLGEGRWTPAKKVAIMESRVKGTDLLFQSLQSKKHSVSTFISASGSGFYGDAGEEVVNESSASGNDFLSQTCRAWEEGALKIRSLGIRVGIIRTGFVLSTRGGGLPLLALPARFGLGAPVGSGKQIISWIHLRDLCRMYEFLLSNQNLEGVFNGVAPHPVSNAKMMESVSKALKRPSFLPAIPGFLLKIVLGEKSDLILGGAHLSSEKIMGQGFRFEFPEIDGALGNLFREKE